MRFSIVIPTYNRQADLKKCLASILVQAALPAEVIIVDDGDLPADYISARKEEFHKAGISFVYYKKNHEVERRGSSESRNRSLELISNDIFFILDDDVVLELDFCEKIMAVWVEKRTQDLIGVGGIIKNRRRRLPLEKIFHAFFGISSKYSWDVNRVGFQVWDEEITELALGYYVHGGVCAYDLEKVKQLKFTIFSGGRTALEDVDFCLRAKMSGYHFLIEPKAKLFHYPSKASRETLLLTGYKEGANRKTIFKNIYKKPSLYLLAWFYWANIGWILRQFLTGNLGKGIGMVKGIYGRI